MLFRWSLVCCTVLQLFALSRAADPAPADLAEYKTTATAAAAIQHVRFGSALPGHLGIGVEVVGDQLKIVRIEIDSAAAMAQLQVIGTSTKNQFNTIYFVRSPDVVNMMVGLDKYSSVVAMSGYLQVPGLSNNLPVQVTQFQAIYHTM